MAAGTPLYERYCGSCHGANLEPAESVFDLRDLAASDKRRFMTSVARGKSTMPAWGTVLTPQQIDALWDFVMSKKADPTLAVAPIPASAAVPPSQDWPCGGDERLLIDSAGNPVWIASDELLSHAIGTSLPRHARQTPQPVGSRLDALIDSQGRVKCIRPTSGSVAPTPAAIEAIGKMTFRPFAAAGQPVAVFAHVQLNLETQ